MLDTWTHGKGVEQQEFFHLSKMRMQNGTVTLEDSLAVSYKTECTLLIWSNNRASWYLAKGIENLGPHKTLYMDSSFSHDC